MTITSALAVKRSAKRAAKLAAKVCAALTLSALPLSAALPAFAHPAFALPAPAQPGDPGLEQSVGANEENATGPAEISVGHVDLGPRVIDGAWVASMRDDSGDAPVWRDPNQTVVRVSDAAVMPAPTGEEYDFLGGVSDPLYVIPQTQKSDVVWLGWNTQDPGVLAQVDRGVTMRIGPISGPGRAWLFLQSGTFGKPLLLADSQSAPADVWVDSATHVHANWVFSAPGVYTARLSFRASTTSGGSEEVTTTLRFAVGSATSFDEALAAPAPDEASGASESSAGARNDESKSAAGTDASGEAQGSQAGLPGWVVGTIGAVSVLCVLGLVALVALRARASSAEKAAAIAEADAREAKRSTQSHADVRGADMRGADPSRANGGGARSE